MGDRGGTATAPPRMHNSTALYPMGDRGGTATSLPRERASIALYPMGDRGGTATMPYSRRSQANYTRWEIGGEPQHKGRAGPENLIIPDGRSGGNRNAEEALIRLPRLYPMGDRGGTATGLPTVARMRRLYPMGDRGGTATDNIRQFDYH